MSGEFYYVIDTLAAAGIAIRRSAAAFARDADRGRPFGREGEEMLAEGAERVGTDDQTGRACDLFRLTDARGRREICLTQDAHRLPLHAEQYDRASHRRITTRYLDWSQGFATADSFFTPDPRIALERIEYEDYLKRSRSGVVGPAPVLYRELLHGR